MAQLVILGHKTRSKEVIEILEMLGGRNLREYVCNVPGYAYSIDEQGIIDLYISHSNSSITFTLEEFLEKFPYKVGDKVLLSGVVKIIKQVCWSDTENEVIYKLETNVRGFSEEYHVHHYDLQPYKEETKEKINVAKLLKDCHQGMELNCTVYDECILDSILEGELYPIKIQTPEGKMLLTKYGSFSCNKHSKCIIFPKDKTTWEGFHRPFEPGDIVITDNNEHAFIYSGENDKFWECYCGVYCGTRNICINSKQWSDRQHKLRLATKKEIEKLFQVIKDNGYKWNPETKTLEKLIELKFKVGDRIKSIDSDRYYIIKDIEFDRYILNNDCFLRFNDEHIFELVVEPKFKVGDVIVNNYRKHLNGDSRSWKIYQITSDKYIFTDGSFMYIQDQDHWALNTAKFDITTLKPFAEVLVRNTNNGRWHGQLYMSYNENAEYPFECVYNCWKQCIPYEGNEHLFNKTDDCADYFKTWE